jgi:hypothetical protein
MERAGWLLGKDYFADSVGLTGRSRPPVAVPGNTTPETFVRRLFTRDVDAGRNLRIVGTTRPVQASAGAARRAAGPIGAGAPRYSSTTRS